MKKCWAYWLHFHFNKDSRSVNHFKSICKSAATMRTDKYGKRTNWSNNDHRTIFNHKNWQMLYIQTSRCPVHWRKCFIIFLLFLLLLLFVCNCCCCSFLILDFFAKWTECFVLCLVFMCTCHNSLDRFFVLFLFVIHFRLKWNSLCSFSKLQPFCPCTSVCVCVFGLWECLNGRIKNKECWMFWCLSVI